MQTKNKWSSIKGKNSTIKKKKGIDNKWKNLWQMIAGAAWCAQGSRQPLLPRITKWTASSLAVKASVKGNQIKIQRSQSIGVPHRGVSTEESKAKRTLALGGTGSTHSRRLTDKSLTTSYYWWQESKMSAAEGKEDTAKK